MAFWGVEVKPGKPFTLKATDATEIKRLHLSQATLGLGHAPTSRSILQCNVGNKSPLFLCVLSPQKVDSCQLNIEFEEAEDVIFSVIGPLSVHLAGYFLGRSSSAYRLNDDESESYGEDIVGTDGEKGSNDDYDYNDSFINDDDPSARGSDVSSTDDDERMPFLSIKERASKKKAKNRNKKDGRLRKKFQIFESDSDENSARVDDSAIEDSVEILNIDTDHKIPKVLSSEVPLSSRVTRSKARSSTLENGETNAKYEKTLEATTHIDKTLDKKEDKPSGDVEDSPIKKGSGVRSKKKRNKESVVINIDDGVGKNMPETQKPATDKAIETSNDVTQSKKKRKKDRREETTERKKQAIDKNMEKEVVGTMKLLESEISSDEVTIEDIKKGKSDGKVAAVQGKKVSILDTAKLKDTGKLLESNLEEAPLRFRLGGEKVIKGLSIGVEGMRVGDKRRLIIPPSLGFSEEGLKKEDVPKDAWLLYEVEAVKVR